MIPRLTNVGAAITGSGFEVHVRFVKKGGLPVTYVGEGVDAAAVPHRRSAKYLRPFFSQLARAVGLTGPRAHAPELTL